jgi:DNA-directed RNA polymerase specialized sigma24 family protein
MSRLPRLDRELLELIAAGDRGAWEELRDRYALALYTQVFYTSGDAADTEQVVAGTLQEAWCCADQFDLSGDVSVAAWLAGLARSVMLERFRSPSPTQSPRVSPPAMEASSP